MLRLTTLLLVCLVVVSRVAPCRAQDQTDQATEAVRGDSAGKTLEEPGADTLRSGYLVKVELPITGTSDLDLIQRIEPLIGDESGLESRPILVLQFESARQEAAGQGVPTSNQFERCLAVARFLTSSKLSGFKAVAYLAEDVQGHAVLPVLACEEIVMAPDAQLGPATLSGESVDQTMRDAYRQIAEHRRVIPVAFALGLLDPKVSVFRMTSGGDRYVLADQREQLVEEGAGNVFQTVKQAGQVASYSANELRHEYKFVSHLVNDRLELIEVLKLRPDSLQVSALAVGAWNAVQVQLHGTVQRADVDWIIRSLKQQWETDKPDFICVRIDSPGGSPADSGRLARWLSDLQSEQVRTVAFVPDQALGDAALIALSCEQLAMGRQARIGGSGAVVQNPQSASDMRSVVKRLSRDLGRPWSLAAAMVDSSLVVHQYRHEDTGAIRIFCAEELSEQRDSERWQKQDLVKTERGLTGVAALEFGLAQHLADDMDAFRQRYNLTDELRPIEPAWKDVWVERLAQLLATPVVAGLLLFAAWFFLSAEMSAPGLGAPGFAACVCFTLFFWSQFLNGTAGWLEVLLFLVGISCVAIEIFVIPGGGAFGMGGAAMIIVSIVLASQSFVIPRNAYQLSQWSTSLSLVLAAIAGVFVSFAVMRRLLPETPYLNRMMLAPPRDDRAVELNERESLVHLEYLTGKKGITTTQLTPSGKARFGDDVVDVISRGEVVLAGVDVRVVDVRGNRVLVESVERRPTS